VSAVVFQQYFLMKVLNKHQVQVTGELSCSHLMMLKLDSQNGRSQHLQGLRVSTSSAMEGEGGNLVLFEQQGMILVQLHFQL